MRINHIAIYVNDLEKMKSFYENHFAAKANKLYHNPQTGLKTYFLTFADETRLELMHRPELAQKNKERYPVGFTHLAFSLGSQDKVDQLTCQLGNEGYTVISGPRTTGDGYYESCILDPEQNQIELVV